MKALSTHCRAAGAAFLELAALACFIGFIACVAGGVNDAMRLPPAHRCAPTRLAQMVDPPHRADGSGPARGQRSAP